MSLTQNTQNALAAINSVVRQQFRALKPEEIVEACTDLRADLRSVELQAQGMIPTAAPLPFDQGSDPADETETAVCGYRAEEAETGETEE